MNAVAMLPAPLTPPECDCTDLDGFMLNVERLMASELVALSTHEEIAAALFLWCRAWKQKPAASLPDDERVMAAFSRLPLARFRKVREAVLRGFVKCSDGRFYHRVLAGEAVNAYERKLAFHKKRDGDAERLRKWRMSQRETNIETGGETRFVAEGQGQGQGQGKKEDDDARTTLSRICEILRIDLQADPTRVTWLRQVEEMMRDGLDPPRIFAATEIARTHGKLNLAYIRAVAFNPPKPQEKANGSSNRKESQHEQRARIIAEDHAGDTQPRHTLADQSEDHRPRAALSYGTDDGR